MKIVILGCGRVGAALANMFDSEGHEVSVIDRDPCSFERLKPDFKGKKLVGLGFDREVLTRAGIESADIFVAAARGDNHNAVSAFVARNHFKVPRVIARIYDSERARLYWNMGIITVAPVSWAVNQIRDFVLHPDVAVKGEFGNGMVKVVECTATKSIAGRPVGEIEDSEHIRVVALERYGQAFMPPKGFVLEEGDRLVFAADSYGLSKLHEILRG